eukprot:scaffold951_cov431-Prasinococcus_capsulatus_cf.AAC.2
MRVRPRTADLRGSGGRSHPQAAGVKGRTVRHSCNTIGQEDLISAATPGSPSASQKLGTYSAMKRGKKELQCMSKAYNHSTLCSTA